jgi:hypothetical protein
MMFAKVVEHTSLPKGITAPLKHDEQPGRKKQPKQHHSAKRSDKRHSPVHDEDQLVKLMNGQ